MAGKKLTNHLYSNCGFFMKQFCRVPVGLSFMGAASAVCSISSATFSSLNILKEALNGNYTQSAVFLMSAASNSLEQGIANQFMLASYGLDILAELKAAIDDSTSLNTYLAMLFSTMNAAAVYSGLAQDRWFAFGIGLANAVGGLTVSAINHYRKRD